MKFSHFVEISPKVKIKKNKKYPFIDMKSISPGERFVSSQESKKFKGGGSKFQDKDILFARITPCLENGKIAQYKSNDLTPAFGSTEFFIFRAKENLINSTYLYYLCYSPIIRKTAEKSMVGASGRQRARLESLKDINIELPNLEEQEKIAAILSAYDELIENNNRRIEILEEMAETIYKEWFVRFRFPGHEKVEMIDSELGKIPEGWEVLRLGEVLESIESGSRPRGGINPKERGIPSIGAENILGLGRYGFEKEKYIPETFYQRMRKGKVQSGDVLLYKDGAKIGRMSMFKNGFPHKICCINEHVFILRTNYSCSQNYLFFYLERPDITGRIANLNSNAAQPGINQAGVKSLPILLPPARLIRLFDDKIDPIIDLLFNLAKKNENLKKSRDILLPKLISGKIDVSDLDIKIEEKK